MGTSEQAWPWDAPPTLEGPGWVPPPLLYPHIPALPLFLRRQKAYEAGPWDAPPAWEGPGIPPPLPKFLTLLLTADEEPNLVNR